MLNKKFKLNFIALTVAYALTPYTEAALVRNDVDYQIFRDFAENKGMFSVGATNVLVKDKNNKDLGTALPNDIPMIDFSVVDVNKRIGTLVNPQYIVSVKHARGYMNDFYFGHYNGHRDVSDNENKYSVVTQNNDKPNESWNYQKRINDYNMPRLNKFVTEVEPITPTLAGEGIDTYKDKEKYPHFVRIGAGTQFIYEKNKFYSTVADKKTESGNDIEFLAEAYRYAIGGTPYKEINIDKVETKEGLIGFGDSQKTDLDAKILLSQDSLTNYGVLGDSGSPLFAFDKQQNKWIFIGPYTYWAGYGKKSWQEWNIYKKDFANTIHAKDNAEYVPFSNTEYHWDIIDNNSSVIKNAQKTILVKLPNSNTPLVNYQKEENENTGQNVIFEGNDNSKSTLVLENNINQGAGGLFFKGNYDVKGKTNDITWLGGGIDVAEGKKVIWHLKNPKDDKLAKLGKGTLEIKGTGENQGELKVGDGVVILNQQPSSGKVQAFSQLGIVSGRSTVVLNSANQINPNKIYFGFRGGRLDINGNNLTFEHIRNIDDGARVVNHNMTNASNITITGTRLITDPSKIYIYNVQIDNDDEDESYRFIHPPVPEGKDLYFNSKCYSYYALKHGGSTRSEMPCNNSSNSDWAFMGNSKNDAQKKAMEYINNNRMNGFSGYFGEEVGKKANGELNVTFNGTTNQNRFLLTGGTNLNGELKVEKGTLFLSGRPTPHARDIANISSTEKDQHFTENNEVVVEDDWIDRTFKATSMKVNGNATLYSGRNVANITSNVTASDNAQVHIGYKAGDAVCVRSDYTGYVTCTNNKLSDKAFKSFSPTNMHGDINLTGNSVFTLGKANLFGTIHSAEQSAVHFEPNSQWHLTGNSQVNQLVMNGGDIHLNANNALETTTAYNQLTVNNLSGQGRFYYFTDLSHQQGDKVVVNQSASGQFTLHVRNKTGEPKYDALELFNASTAQRNNLTLTLDGGKVDLGAYSYTLQEKDGVWRLYNPKIEEEIKAKQLAKRTDEPQNTPVPEAPNAASSNQNDPNFSRTEIGNSTKIEAPQFVMLTYKDPNGNILAETVVLKTSFDENTAKNQKSFTGLIVDSIKPNGTNAYVITYKKDDTQALAEAARQAEKASRA
ncbi:S6 family peptidase, partial [Haemophilus haemolyticus]|uniref:S6 family peptidase n=1 Tax=Haemophilus haemolyticus TaxID=726 RepID=UPI000AC559CE